MIGNNNEPVIKPNIINLENIGFMNLAKINTIPPKLKPKKLAKLSEMLNK
ncbi:NADH dehydrogenase subunit A [Rickettsia bellii OSU 85-389]|nr:NADH dehydrogenase subunit A [Rickettsia bellii OSU 85-389]